MRTARSALLATVLLLAASGGAVAQLPVGLWLMADVQPAFGAPRGDFAAGPVGAGDGAGFVGGAAVGRGPVGVYGEFQRMLFECDVCGELELDDRLADTGWEAGLLVRAPTLRFGVRPWIRGGVLLHQLLFAGQGGTTASDVAMGPALGVGLRVPVYRFVEIAPAVTYQRYEAEFDFADDMLGTRTSEVSYLTYRLGLAVRL
jgi:hypothetical protein